MLASSPSPLAQSSSPPVTHFRSTALASAYEALRDAKAMLRGEQSPHFPTDDMHRCSSSASALLPLPAAALGNDKGCLRTSAHTSTAYQSCSEPSQIHHPRSSDSGSNGATQSRSTDRTPNTTTTINNSASPVMLADSPDAQPPVDTAAWRTSTSAAAPAAALRCGQHVQFDVPLATAEEKEEGQHPRERPASWSPQPVPPIAPAVAFSSHAVTEVDARTVELLHCLTYDEVRFLRESLAGPWGGMNVLGRGDAELTSLRVDAERGAAARPAEAAAFACDVASPSVLLDVDEQLRYARFFYAQLPTQGDEDVEADAAEKTQAGVCDEDTKTSAFRSSSTCVETAASAKATPDVPATYMDSSEDELTLSPITQLSLSPSPVQQRKGRSRPHYEETPALPVRGASWHPSPASPPPPPAAAVAGPSILISPQQPRRRSKSAEQLNVVAGQTTQQPQWRDARHRRPSPSATPTDDALNASSSPSRIASVWCLRDFDVGRRIGAGASSRTFTAREKQSKVMIALKCVPKPTFSSSAATTAADAEQNSGSSDGEDGAWMLRVMQAARLHMSAGRRCPQVVRLYTFFEDAQHVYFTLEHAEDGDLATYAAQRPQGKLPENYVRHVVRQLALALKHLHGSGVVHGAVAPRHVLLKDHFATVKLGGFGQATRQRSVFSEEERLQRLYVPVDGAVDYDAPEVLCNRQRGCKADMWALGVLTYELLCGYLPFEHISTLHAKQLVCMGVVYYPRWMTATAKSFIAALLCVDEAGRLSAAEALQHPFLLSAASATLVVPPTASNAAASTTETVEQQPRHGSASSTASSTAAAAPSHRFHQSSRSSDLVVVHSKNDQQRDTYTMASTAESPFGVTPFLPLAGCTSTAASLTMSSGSSSSHSASVWSPRRGGETGHSCVSCEEEGAESGSVSSISTAPTAHKSSFATPVSFMNLALPSHSWRTATQPYGETAGLIQSSSSGHGGAGLPSVVLTSPPSAPSVHLEEGTARLRRRSSATSVKSLALSSRPSLTATFSDVSASFLSTTCAPAGTAVPLVAPDGLASVSRTSSNHAPSGHSTAATSVATTTTPATAHAYASSFLLNSETRVPCSVTVSSLTAASPHAASEWASALDVDVSASSSDRSPQVQLSRHSPTLSSFVGGQRAATKREGEEVEAAQWPRALPALALADVVKAPAAQTDDVATAVADAKKESEVAGRENKKAVTAAEAARRKKKATRGPECAMRLDFDCLSDDEW